MAEAIDGGDWLCAPGAAESSGGWLQAQREPGPDVTRLLPL